MLGHHISDHQIFPFTAWPRNKAHRGAFGGRDSLGGEDHAVDLSEADLTRQSVDAATQAQQPLTVAPPEKTQHCEP